MAVLVGNSKSVPSPGLQTVPAVSVTAFFATEPPSDAVVVTLINKTGWVVDDVVVDVWLGSHEAMHSGGVIGGYQSRVDIFNYPRRSFSGYVVVDYIIRGVRDSAASPVQITWSTSSGGNALAALGAAILSLIGVILGAILGHLFTARRDRAQSRFEWQKMLYERHQAAYTAFLSSWSSSTNGRILEEQFYRLMSDAPVPESIISLYRQVRAKLAEEGTSTADKQLVADVLYGRISDFISTPRRIGILRRFVKN